MTALHDWFGLDGTVLLWIKSYLSNRKQKNKIGDSFSEAVILPFGVPQGSVLGPLSLGASRRPRCQSCPTDRMLLCTLLVFKYQSNVTSYVNPCQLPGSPVNNPSYWLPLFYSTLLLETIKSL